MSRCVDSMPAVTRRSVFSGSGVFAGHIITVILAGTVLAACEDTRFADAGGGADAADAAPHAADDIVVPADAVHVLGTSESLALVLDMVRLDDGTIWLLNQTEPYFFAFDAQGEIRRSWGRRGGGPAEFRSPAALVVGPAGDVWVHDRAPHALIRVSGEESEPKRIVLPRDSLPPNRVVVLENLGIPEGRTWLSATADAFLAARSKPSSGEGQPLYDAEILSIRDDGTLHVLIALGDHMEGPPPEFASATLFLPNPLWAICPDGSMVLYDPRQNAIRQLSLGGTETAAAVALPAERRLEITPDRVFGLVYRLMVENVPADERPDSALLYAGFEGQFSEVSADISPVFPEYADLQCTAGTIWIQPFDMRGSIGRGPVWLRITPDEIRRVRLPDSFKPFRFTGDRVYGVILDELDVQSIAWIDIG